MAIFDKIIRMYIFFRSNILPMVLFSSSFLVYSLCKIHRKVIDRAWFLKVSPKAQKIQTEDKVEKSKPPINNQPYNPEVCNIKIFLMITFLFFGMLIVGAVIGLNVESKFHIFQFFGRFILSVIIPSIVYLNNPDLRIFVKEMFW